VTRLATLLAAAREEAARSEAESAEPLRVGTAQHAAVRTEETSSAVPTAPREPSPLAEAAAQASAPEVAPAVAQIDDEPPVHPAEAAVWTCQISFWRGYRKAAFYAGMFYEGEDVAVAESPHFRAHGNGLPDPTPEAEEAYDALRERLEADGWTLARAGDTWFDHVFERKLTAAAEPAPE
jgi:hypothetical protein